MAETVEAKVISAPFLLGAEPNIAAPLPSALKQLEEHQQKHQQKHALGQALAEVEDTNFNAVVSGSIRDMCAGPLVRGMFWGIGAAVAEYALRKIFG